MRWTGILLLAALGACGSLTSTSGARVARERLLVTEDAALDPYFLAVYGHQMALAGIDARRADRSASLARALDLRPNADRATLSAALRAALDRARVRRVRVRVEPASDLDDRVGAWQRALSAASPRGPAEEIAERYERVMESVTVTLTPVAAEATSVGDGGVAAPDVAPLGDGAAVPELTPVLDAIGLILRDAEATRRCMGRLLGRTPEVFARGEALRAGAQPRWWPEFDAAERFVLGLHARATLHEQESVRAQRWVLGALRPESEGGDIPPDDEDESPSESGPPPAAR